MNGQGIHTAAPSAWRRRRLKYALGIMVLIIFGTAASVFVQSRLEALQRTALGNAKFTFSIAPLDEKSEMFLATRDTAWTPREETEAAISKLVTAAGFAPSVRELAKAFAGGSPPWGWIRSAPWQRRYRAEAAEAWFNVRRSYWELWQSSDAPDGPVLRISKDEQVAILWDSTNSVLVFENAATGLRQVYYRRQEKRQESVDVGGERVVDSEASGPGSRAYVTDQESDAVRMELARLSGQWLLVSGASYGLPIPGPGPQVRIIIKGSELITISERGTIMRERFSIDPSKTPKTIDRELIARSPTIIRRLGIYEVGADTFKLCEFGVPSSSSNRPTFFSSTDAILKIYRRHEVAD